ncbi:hypothetical protein KCU89_g128, partial [Aureobasidium melanogenum]
MFKRLHQAFLASPWPDSGPLPAMITRRLEQWEHYGDFYRAQRRMFEERTGFRLLEDIMSNISDGVPMVNVDHRRNRCRKVSAVHTSLRDGTGGGKSGGFGEDQLARGQCVVLDGMLESDRTGKLTLVERPLALPPKGSVSSAERVPTTCTDASHSIIPLRVHASEMLEETTTRGHGSKAQCLSPDIPARTGASAAP